MEKSTELQGYIDADHIGDLDQRVSTTGYVFTVVECAISWKPELQDTIALSTTEPEYMATIELSKEALWLKGFVETFSIIQDSVQVHCNNQSVIDLSKDHRYHKRTKHIDERYHKIRQWIVNDKVIDLVKISTKKNQVDMMTKTIPLDKFIASLNFIKIFQR